MFAVVRKLFLASVLVLTVLATGAWQSNPVALAQTQDPGIPETPLYPGLSWANLGASTQTIRTSANGDSVSLAGERYKAQEQFMEVLWEDVGNYYSTAQLAKAGWVSYDAYGAADGDHYVFYHEAGVYLSVEYLNCPNEPTSICVSVWKSEQVGPLPTPPATEAVGPQATTFGKSTPKDGATGVSPTNAELTWESLTNADKYGYCIQTGKECEKNDGDWTSSYDRSVTLTNLSINTTYYWQVRGTTCEGCTPKPWVYANNDDAWTFKTGTVNQVTILGNAGVPGAVLSFSDGTAKTVTADSTGAYAIKVSYNWTGTITPTKSGYLFTPTSASFTNVQVTQTIQNFFATPVYTISGNTGQPGVTLSYTNGTPQTVTSDANGNYSFGVPAGWSGTVTPSKTSYTFTPANRPYTNVQANQPAQNYTAALITYTISGSVGALGAGATLTYDVNNSPQFVTADGAGNYSVTVPWNWTGTITPHKIKVSFAPANRPYTNVLASVSGQNFTPSNCANCADKDSVGVFRPSNGLLYLKNLNITGFADIGLNYGLPGDYPVVGDWDGNGTSTIGIYRNGLFYLRNSNTIGFAEIVFAFGQPGDQPIAGDWDNDGDDTVGVYRPSNGQFLLRNDNSAGTEDASFFLGNVGDVGIAGDWNGDGFDTVGVFRPINGIIFLKNTNTTGFADVALNYGIPGDKPVTGDWNNDGTDTIGVYRNGTFYLKNANTVGFADIVFGLGLPGDMPIGGDWDAEP